MSPEISSTKGAGIMLEGHSCSSQNAPTLRHCSGRQGRDGKWDEGGPALNRLPREWSQPQGCQSSRNMWTMFSTGWDSWDCAGQGVWTWMILVDLPAQDIPWHCAFLPAPLDLPTATRCLQLSGQPDPSLSLERCLFIPKSSHLASQGISMDRGGWKIHILEDLRYQLITILLQVMNARAFGKSGAGRDDVEKAGS